MCDEIFLCYSRCILWEKVGLLDNHHAEMRFFLIIDFVFLLRIQCSNYQQKYSRDVNVVNFMHKITTKCGLNAV